MQPSNAFTDAFYAHLCALDASNFLFHATILADDEFDLLQTHAAAKAKNKHQRVIAKQSGL
jgi:hypothetical protein